MVDPQLREIHECIRVVIHDISVKSASTSPKRMKVSGPQCRIDRQTFELFEKQFPVRQYSRGVVQAFINVYGLITSEELQLAAREVALARRQTGKYSIQVYMDQDELDILRKVAVGANMSMSSTLEACVLVYIQAKTICDIKIRL